MFWIISMQPVKRIELKFIHSEKATKFCEISTVDLSYVVPVKSTVEILQNFVAFSEYMNFTNLDKGSTKTAMRMGANSEQAK